MALLQSEDSYMTIEVNIRSVDIFDDTDTIWINYETKIRHKNKTMMDSETMHNTYIGSFDTDFDLPECIRKSIERHDIRVIETEQGNFARFIVFPSHALSFRDRCCTDYIKSNLFNFGYWVAEIQYYNGANNENDSGKIMFTMEVEDTVLLDFANKLEAEYESLKNKIEKNSETKVL